MNPPLAPLPARFDLYTPIHKALRHFMGATLVAVGRLDPHDPGDLDTTLGQLDTLLDLLESHLHHENEFVHPALEAQAPGTSARAASDHVEHGRAIAQLRGEARALHSAETTRRPALALALYRHLALFVAENLQHMHVEETIHNAALWARCGDAELSALHDRLLATLAAWEVRAVERWMPAALSPAERAAVLGAARPALAEEAAA